MTEEPTASAGGVRHSLPFLTAIGILSVIHWHATVLHGAGDLRFYGAVQLYAALALFAALLLPARYTRGADLLFVAGFYALAKICETADRRLYALGHVVSGHTLKHLAAAAAGFWILRCSRSASQFQQLKMNAPDKRSGRPPW